MTAPPRVGVVGATGVVGRHVVAELLARGLSLRAGSRQRDVRDRAWADVGARFEWKAVDVNDHASLAGFCDGCAIVVNAAGPSCEIGDRVAIAALAAEAHYVDPGAHLGLGISFEASAAVIAAGMYPGLTELLPRLLAARLERPERLTAYVGGCDRFTPAAAADYLASLRDGFGQPNTSWQAGRRVSQVAPSGDVMIPFFPRAVAVQPFLTRDSEQLATTLGLTELRCYSVFDGRHVLAALSRAAGACDSAILAHAAALDVFGRDPYQMLVFEMSGWADGRQQTLTLMLKAAGGSALTGAAAVLAVVALNAGAIRSGVHRFADVLDPSETFAELQQSSIVNSCHLFDASLAAAVDGEI